MFRSVIFLYLLLAIYVMDQIFAKQQYLRIVGGSDTEIIDAPYLVSVFNHIQPFCGGSLIRPAYVLTAAHCFPKFKGLMANYHVRAGSNYFIKGGEIRRITKIVVHPDFNRETMDYDICILTLSWPYKLNDFIQTIPLGSEEPRDGDTIMVSGWGKTEEKGFFATTLKSVNLPVISRSLCRRMYSSVTLNMFCAGYLKGKKAPCHGDSGGSAVFNSELVGIVSWSSGCAREKSPSVYTNIVKLRTWIDSFFQNKQ